MVAGWIFFAALPGKMFLHLFCLVCQFHTVRVLLWLQAEPAHKEAVRGIAFSPSDLKFATCSDDSTIKASTLPSFCATAVAVSACLHLHEAHV